MAALKNRIAFLFLTLVFTTNFAPMSAQQSSDDRARLIYVYDAFCGWCYGFSGVMKQVYEDYQDQMDFQVVSGGMMLGDREGPVGEVAPFIKGAYTTVETHTGVTFGEAYLEKLMAGTHYMNSMPPALAMTVFRDHLPDQTVPFAHALQRMFYYDGVDGNDTLSYGRLAATFGLDEAEFVSKMAAPATLERTREDFQLSNQLGVNGFPTVFLMHHGQLHLLARGYTDPTTFTSRIDSVLATVPGGE